MSERTRFQPGYRVRADSSVEFVLHRPETRQAEVVGDFTGWAGWPLPMRRAAT
jgi:1,4-alpha-glucan branching enzyme